MCEILFRGKDIIGNWHIGSLLHVGNAWYISDNSIIKSDFYEVIPYTIGQFTGMYDKNGEMIFEGDILKYLDSDEEVNYFSIVYQDSAFLVEDCGIIEPELLTSYECLELELAGNIFDNSELLEVR